MSNDRTERINWPHDAPGPLELVEVVRDYLSDDLGPGTVGRARWMSRVAANALTVALRELGSAEVDAARHRRHLEALGVPDDRGLAEAIRAGDFDDRRRELVDSLWDTTIVKLTVANPEYRDPSLEPD